MTIIRQLLMVALGGALGSVARYGLTLLASALAVRPEWGTLAANVCGSFLIGLACPGWRSEYQLFLTVGLCGGFTTFSTFSSQALRLLQAGQWLGGGLYLLGSVALSLAMVALGWYCRQRIWGA